MGKLTVLYIHHGGQFGGASRSLLELIRSFPQGSIKPILLTQEGSTADVFRKFGVQCYTVKGISQLDNGRYNYYRNWRWLVLLREMYYLFPTLIGLFKIRKNSEKIDLIHVNEIQLIIPALFCKYIFNKPIFMHSRSVQRNYKDSFLGRIVFSWINENVSMVFPIDRAVKSTLPPFIKTKIVYNGLVVSKNDFKPFNRLITNDDHQKTLSVGMVSSLMRHKGVSEFVDAAHILKQKGYNINFSILGDTGKPTTLTTRLLNYLGISHYIRDEIVQKIDKYSLNDNFELLPFDADTSKFYIKVDLLCFPNLMEAIGRPIFEAALFKVPSIVCLSESFEDTFINNQTGLITEPKNPYSLAEAIEFFYMNPSKVIEFGDNAYKLVTQIHDLEHNANVVLNSYLS